MSESSAQRAVVQREATTATASGGGRAATLDPLLDAAGAALLVARTLHAWPFRR